MWTFFEMVACNSYLIASGLQRLSYHEVMEYGQKKIDCRRDNQSL